MRHRLIFFDLDDTLYPPSTGIWAMIRQRMEEYMREQLRMDPQQIPALRRRLYETYGTTMRGLQNEYELDTEDFLAFVHDVPVEALLAPDPALRQALLQLPQRRLIFTNADCTHAGRVIRSLGLEDVFEKVIDIHQVAPACKPQPEAFQTALAIAGESDPSACVFIDDSPRNLQGARDCGLSTILIGSPDPNPAAHASISSLTELPAVLRRLAD